MFRGIGKVKPYRIFASTIGIKWCSRKYRNTRVEGMLEDFGRLEMEPGSVLMINLADERGDDWAIIRDGPRA